MFKKLLLSLALLAGIIPVSQAQNYNPNTVIFVDSIKELKNVIPASLVSPFVSVKGFYGPGTPGGGNFQWIASSCIPDGGVYIQSNKVSSSNGCWVRQFTGPVSSSWWGSIGDGHSHPLSDYFTTLADAQSVYPFARSLSDEVDGEAILAAEHFVSLYVIMPPAEMTTLLDYGGEVQIPIGKFLVNETIFVNPHVTITGQGGFQTYTGTPTCSTVTDPGSTFICWTGPTTGSPAIDATGFYASAKPAFSGNATGGSTTTITFNASGVSGINSNTFIGSVVAITSGAGSSNSPRLIVGGSYSAPTYTATVLDPFNNGTPDSTSVLNIAAISQGQRYTALEGPSGTQNCNSSNAFNITLTPGVSIENLTVLAGSGGDVGIRLNCADHGKIENVTISGFNTDFNINASYYVNLNRISSQHKWIGGAYTNDNWGVITDVDDVPLLSNGDVSRPTATDRPWYIGWAGTADPNPLLNTSYYCFSGGSGVLDFHGGNAEQSDRGWFGACENLNFHTYNIENIGLYSAIAGQVALYTDGTKISYIGGNFGQASSRNGTTFPYVPVFSGSTPYLTVKNLIPQSGQHVQWAGTFDFTFGGLVKFENVTPGDLDTGPSANTPFIWDSYPIISAPVSLQNSWGPLSGSSVQVSDNHGRICLSGQITGGTDTSGTTTGTIPSIYDPLQNIYSVVSSGSALDTAAGVNITTSGQITLQSTLTAANLSYDGICWRSSSGY